MFENSPPSHDIPIVTKIDTKMVIHAYNLFKLTVKYIEQ